MANVTALICILVVFSFPGATSTLAEETALSNGEIDRLWAEMSRAVREGDYQALTAAYHPEAVLVNGYQNTCYPISAAFEQWKQGLLDTKAGRMRASVSTRFTQRLHGEESAFEIGVYRYTEDRQDGEDVEFYVHFEMLLVKREEGWKILMEYQKGPATEEEWRAAKSPGGDPDR